MPSQFHLLLTISGYEIEQIENCTSKNLQLFNAGFEHYQLQRSI
ncbi:hypothetical protein A33Q_0065 [Indibacter alkaliphilus LW1]|uniref:Uncharacterized protein n=1 Tax=Indibacter alkaliphilus (strain CCUG 57479 / KCTC 22604 / LW1) TaxID=1189612 RepID=S2E7K0_INDAL|nr:hypothetical protein A33Q_0065 [Indibacter alkaliphilus LW1]